MPIILDQSELIQTGNNTVAHGATNLSVSCWVKFNTTTATGQNRIFWKEFSAVFEIARRNGFSDQIRCTVKYSDATTRTLDGPILTGKWTHVALTATNGAQKLYMDGVLVASATDAKNLDAVGASRKIQVGSTDVNVMQFEVDDPAIWASYILTATDVLDLRNGTKQPADISTVPDWRATLDGTNGSPVIVGDAGLVDSSGGGRNFTTVTGTSTWDGTEAVFHPSVDMVFAEVGKSGEFITFAFKDHRDQLIEAQNNTPTINPSITVDGGAPISLTSSIFHADQAYVVYRLSTPITAGQVVLLTAAEGWIINGSASYATPAYTNEPVTNSVGVELLPGTLSTGVTAPGFNIAIPRYYNPVKVMANLMKECNILTGTGVTLNADGYPTAGTAITAILCRDDVDGLGWNGTPLTTGAEVYILRWDGLGDVTLTGTSGTVVTLQAGSVTGQATNNQRTYTVTDASGVAGIQINLDISGGVVSNIRVIPPGERESAVFNSNFLRMLKGARAIRMMDAIETNGSNISAFSHYNATSRATYFGRNESLRKSLSIVDVANATNTDNWFQASDRVYINIQLTAHGLIDGETISISGAANVTFSFGAASINGTFTVRVIDADHVKIGYFRTGGGTVTGTQTPGGTVTRDIWGGLPLECQVQLVNQLPGCALWICIPHLLPDADVHQVAEYVAANLATSRKVYVEYSNENWNSAAAFTQFDYFYGKGQQDAAVVAAFPNKYYAGHAWYGQRASEIHSIFRDRFAMRGRKLDVVRVLAGQFANVLPLTNSCSWVTTLGRTFDLIALGPYWDNNTVSGDSAITDLVSVPALHDITAVALRYPKLLQDRFDAHIALLASYPGVGLAVYEHGPSVFAVGGASSNVQSRSAGRHPRIDYLTRLHYNLLETNSVRIACAYHIQGNNGQVFAAGDANWPIYLGYNQVAGKGDGSDGLFNNTSDYADLRNIVSVLGYSWNQIIASYNRFIDPRILGTDNRPNSTWPAGVGPERLQLNLGGIVQ